ncbi:helicase superfamily c-terminal domain [Teratosphaeria destructans]|uniref:ATP-dependent RNA helicase n=1 Tax=Teratosphaeria destructans TaxID=418781 RepID=A0A9W7W3V8_9PEZI|nr:helicase superfamily c-terminal domain [Teratosphaeria destructans]
MNVALSHARQALGHGLVARNALEDEFGLHGSEIAGAVTLLTLFTAIAGLDDWSMCIAFLAMIGLTVVSGLGLSNYNGLFTGKTTEAEFLRTPAGKTRTLFWWSTVAMLCLVSAMTIVVVLMCFVQCTPFTHIFDLTGPGTCLNMTVYYYAYLVASDIVIAGMPVPMLWALKRPTRERVVLVALFAVMLVPVIASIVRFTSEVQIGHLTSTKIGTRIGLRAIELSVIELDLGIACACAPSIKALIAAPEPSTQRSSSVQAPSEACCSADKSGRRRSIWRSRLGHGRQGGTTKSAEDGTLELMMASPADADECGIKKTATSDSSAGSGSTLGEAIAKTSVEKTPRNMDLSSYDDRSESPPRRPRILEIPSRTARPPTPYQERRVTIGTTEMIPPSIPSARDSKMANAAGFSTTLPVEQMGGLYKSMTGKLQQPLLKALEVKGYQYMSPVQERVLTELPDFRADCLVQAKTGTGKTIAFLLPTLHSLLTDGSVPAGQVGVLIISPTRELATQIKTECDLLTSQLRPKIDCHTAYGGTKKEQHLRSFLNGKPTVLVATPGRLNDYLSDDDVAEKFKNLRTLILDEADTMLEAGFLPDITRVLSRIPPKSRGWQGMCFSATMPDKIKAVLGKVLKPGYTHITTVDPNDVPTIEQVDQYSIIIRNVGETYPSLAALLDQERKHSPQTFKAIIFGTTANGVGLMYDLFKVLLGRDINVYELHSRLSQTVRTKTTEEFKKVPKGIMFASDVIGRGMDFPNVNLVVQIGIPSNGEQYVHRVGRTARAGTSGRAVIILTEQEQFFLKVNKHLPIKPYTIDLAASAAQAAPAVQQALGSVDEVAKSKAYQAYLGFQKTFMKNLRTDPPGLVAVANEYALSLGCPEPPLIDKMVVGKMGLKGVRGLNVGHVERAPRPGQDPPKPNASALGGRVEKPGAGVGRQNGGARAMHTVSERGQGRGRGRGGRGGRRAGGATPATPDPQPRPQQANFSATADTDFFRR